ncbi:MAG TPA: UDP-N-acetylglucosamine 1-carboxyvinyltransferase [bacterium]|nr:UDP-N-acetylglucosamine 1-carboxyvinyltransferase [bacterium]
MENLIIKGGKRLSGTVLTSGAKNAALPILAATILTEGKTRLLNVPDVVDIDSMCKLLSNLGVAVSSPDSDRHTIELNIGHLSRLEAPYDLVRKMRASVIVLGPMLAKYGHARVSMPGGCAIGERPINMHLAALAKMGASIEIDHGYVEATAKRLVGTSINLDYPTVGGTENIICAAALARGTTVIDNAAREPEIVDLADFLNKAGAKVSGAGTHQVIVDGVDTLSGVEHSIIPDRIEAGTYALAAAITGGEVTVSGCNPNHLGAPLEKLLEAGCEIATSRDSLTVKATGRARPVSITTQPYPGYPTDLQAQWLAFMTLADGSSIIKETVFERRFTHVQELRRMGAKITVDGDTAVVTGVERLQGAPVMCTDIRASASLILAGLAAENSTVISRVYHLDRGYERIEEKLRPLGAEISREQV